MTDQTTIQTPDPRLIALLAVAAQIARTDDITQRIDDLSDREERLYLVPEADLRRLRRALKNLSRRSRP
jgi:hypothetical protein